MFFGGGIFGLRMLVAWVWGLYDVATTPAAAVRNLPKVAWLLIVLVLSFLGVLAWLALGRPQGAPFAVTGGLRRGGDDARDDAAHLSDRERRELERREYYKRMDEELDRRLEEKRRRDSGEPA